MSKVDFLAGRAPGIAAGEYELTVTQHVVLDGHDVDEVHTHAVRFGVSADRFRLAPQAVDSTFPLDQSMGTFGRVLPHVVLHGPSLPWQRTADGASLPWLALLVFDAAEGAPAVTEATALALVPSAVVPGGTLPSGTTSYPLVGLDSWEHWDETCRVIDVRSELFSSLAPSANDLRWLAHVREVEGKCFSVVVANALPRAGAKTVVHLVSLEGLAALLPGDDGQPSPALAPHSLVRLLSLASFSFAVTGDDESFTALGRRTVGEPSTLRWSPPRLAAGDSSPVGRALEAGFVPVAHDRASGGPLTSWYRGPLVPYPAPLRIDTPLRSSDGAIRFEPEMGLLDVSYAAAWQLGRLLALQSREFSSALMAWRRRARRDAAAHLEREVLHARISPPPALRLAAAAAGTSPMLEGLHASLRDLTTPPRPRARPPSPPARVPAPRLGDAPAPAASAVPVLLTDWLCRLSRLEGVPYRYLVPHEAMLPAESLRFFHLDPSWVAALVDGALSLGRACAADVAHEARLRPPPPTRSESGFVMRSRAVQGWPGMQLDPIAAGAPAKLLRRDRLDATTLLVLYDSALEGIDLHEAPEGVHFGFKVDEHELIRPVRAVGGSAAGEKLPGQAKQAAPRVVGGRALRIHAFATQLHDALKPARFTPAEFALQLVEGVGLVQVRLLPRRPA
jgi:hypothetical protein